MSAQCPKDPNHKVFRACCYLAQEVIVDQNGNVLTTMQSAVEVQIPADPASEPWTCTECGSEAEVHN